MMAPQKCKIGETSPSKTYAPSDFHASASKLVDDDDGLCNQNQKLIGEMAGFLASLECSPGDDNSVATWKHDNYSSAGLENTHAAVKASVAHRSPSMEDADDEDYDPVEEKVANDRGGGTVDGGEGRREPRTCRSLGPIDENEAGGQSGEYEFYNDDSYRDLHQTSPGESGNGDEDSLVAMAQRMDAASVISDPSIITGTQEKFLALPSSKLTAGLKKLGRMGGGGGKKPIPPPPYPRKAAAPPPPPPRRQENTHWAPDEGEPMDDDRRRSASSSKSFDDMDGLRRSLPNVGAETREVPGSSERGRGLSHSPSAADGIPTGGVTPAPAAAPGETNAHDEKIAAKRKHKKNHKHKRKSRIKGKKKKGDVNLEDSMQGIGFNTRVDEACPLRIHANHGPPGRRRKKKSAAASSKPAAQPTLSNLYDSMQGMGFNTRIHEASQQNCYQYNGGPMPGQPASERPVANEKAKEEAVWSENPGAAKGPILEESDRSGSNDGTANSNDSDAQTEIFYESCTDSDESDHSFTDEDDGSYDSDANTEVYYESTDESDFSSSEEELEAVGTSVELAVQDLNNKRALVKVKNLFGRRG